MENFVQETDEPALEPSDRSAEKGDVSLVFRREAEVSTTRVLYIREHLVDVQKQLDGFMKNKRKNTLYTTGPPGCGKTCFLYLWARRLSVLEKKCVLIVQFREKEPCFIWIREAGGALWRMDEAIKAKGLEDRVDEVLEKCRDAGTPFDLCIHDGVLDQKELCSNMLSALNTARTNGLIKKVVHVTSLAFTLSTGGQDLSHYGPISRLAMDSWREEDYRDAVGCGKFLKALGDSRRSPFETDYKSILAGEAIVDDRSNGGDDNNDDEEEAERETEALIPNEHEAMDTNDEYRDGDGDDDGASIDTACALEVIRVKYFFAGGSARFMFDYLLDDLRDRLDERIKGVKQGDWIYFAQESIASSTPGAVNTLMQQFNGICSPVSKYVLVYAYEKCKSALVRSVRAAANKTGNPVLKGWAFELEQIDLIRSSYESTDHNPESVTNGNGFTIRPTSSAEFDEEVLESVVIRNCAVIWCLKWNQGCFDVAFYKDGILITLQFTEQEKHSLKLQYVRKLRDAITTAGLRLDKCVHIGLREKDWTRLQFDEPKGNGRQFLDEAAEFTVHVYHSPPLQKILGESFECRIPIEMLLSTVNMWELGRKKSRRNKREPQ